jgi:carbon storage regulator
MLVLSRRQGEEICIDRDVTICVLKARNGLVRLGISAPSEIRVVRKELIDTLPCSQRGAAAAPP